jgi:uncharacterized membrane protein
MFAPLTWFFSPIGRWFAVAGAAVAFVLAAFWHARQSGKDALRREQLEESERRTRNALEADDSVRSDIARGGLLKDDGHRRD